MVESAWGVDVDGSGGTGVSVGGTATFVSEFCACTVCATAVSMSYCVWSVFPQDVVSIARQTHSDKVLNLCKIIYILS
jgi:hypothetical protein